MEERIRKIMDDLEEAVSDIRRATIDELEDEIVYKEDLRFNFNLGEWSDGSGLCGQLAAYEACSGENVIEIDIIDLIKRMFDDLHDQEYTFNVEYMRRLAKTVSDLADKAESKLEGIR